MPNDTATVKCASGSPPTCGSETINIAAAVHARLSETSNPTAAARDADFGCTAAKTAPTDRTSAIIDASRTHTIAASTSVFAR